MKTLLFYFLQVILASGVLYAYYHFFLRNSRFHQYNRFYLLAATLLSLIVPLLHIDIYFSSQEDIPVIYQALTEFRTGNAAITNITSSSFNYINLVQSFYWLVAVLLLIRLGIGLLRIKRLRATHPAEKLQQVSLINTREAGTPFSFFRWLFWNERINIDSPGGQKIFRHEMFHIQQKHSWDIIYLELLTTLCWINPFFHLIKKETQAIHEFLADRFAAGQENKWEYAELLVMQALQTRQRLVNPFFHNQIKRRIAMITNSSTSSYQYLRKIMVLPVILFTVTLVAINCSSKDVKDNDKPEEEKAIAKKMEKQLDQSLATNPKLTPDSEFVEHLQKLKQKIVEDADPDNKIFDKTEINAMFPGGQREWQDFLVKNLNPNTPVDKGAPEGTYKVMLQFIVDRNGNISDLKPLTHFGYGMEEEVVRVMKLSPNWSPAIQNGKTVKAYTKQPITFAITAE